MLEQIKKEIETDALVKFKNGKSVYGIIIDLFSTESKLEDIRFVPNQNLTQYRATESNHLVIRLNSENIKELDICLR